MKKEHSIRKSYNRGTEIVAKEGPIIVIIPDYDPNYAHFYLLSFSNLPAILRQKENADLRAEEARHLNFILAAGTSLKTSTMCPCCHKNKVTHFSLKDGKLSSCCSNNKCKCYCKGSGTLFPFDLSVFALSQFQVPAEKLKLETFFKKTLGLPERLSPTIIHSFFKKSYEQQLSACA